MSKAKKKLSRHVLIPLLISVPIISYAELQITPTLLVSGLYTDNVTLAQTGMEESDFITRISPGIIANLRSNSTTFDFVYVIENLLYAEDSNRNSSFQQLQANLNSELINDYFFVDANANKFQSVIDSSDPVFSNVQLTNNRTNVETFGISPYMQFPVFSFAQSELRYRYTDINYDDNLVRDSVVQQINFFVRANQSSRRISWMLNYDNQVIDYKDTTNDFIREDINLDLSYRASSSLALVGLIGYEDVEYVDIVNAPNITDSYWELGFAWDITRRTYLELRVGDRYDDDTYYGRFASSTRNSIWEFLYAQDLTTAANQQLSRVGVSVNETTEVSGDTSETTNTNNQGAASLSAEPFLEKRLSFMYRYNLRGNGVLIYAYTLERSFQLSSELEKDSGSNTRIDWQVLPRTVLSFLGSYQNRFFETRNSTIISRQLALRATRELSSYASGFLQYRNIRANFVEAGTSNVENIIEATIELTF